MRTATMGRVVVPAKIESQEDLYSVAQGKLAPENVRSADVPEALVDTGATYLSLPRRLIQQLGLRRFRTRRSRTATGFAEVGMYGSVQLTVQGRDCFAEVAEVSDDCPVLIGQIPLESLDFVVDPVNHRLIGNPDHGGEHMFDLLGIYET
jgi:predicted aspartyl protease